MCTLSKKYKIKTKQNQLDYLNSRDKELVDNIYSMNCKSDSVDFWSIMFNMDIQIECRQLIDSKLEYYSVAVKIMQIITVTKRNIQVDLYGTNKQEQMCKRQVKSITKSLWCCLLSLFSKS